MYFALAVAIALGFWGDRGVQVPCQPVAISGADARMQIPSGIPGYGTTTANMRTAGCTILLSNYAAYLRRNSPDLYCADVVHEVGHVAGLPHRDDGVMNEVIADNAIWDCAHWKAYARRERLAIRR